jgi:hypothetical protein
VSPERGEYAPFQDGLDSEGVDLVFNVEVETGSSEYQVFQKINNWTGGRLEGFTIQVGFGVGQSFQSVADSAVDMADLNIAVPSDVWDPEQLAIFLPDCSARSINIPAKLDSSIL